jgi:pimeloyl-ACP methyl ester carboxylesterase
MAETGLPIGAVYTGATIQTIEQARKDAEKKPDGYIPSAFNPATCAQRGYCKVARTRVPEGGNKTPSPDAISKGAKIPYTDGGDKQGFNVYYEVHGKGKRHVVFIMGLNNSCFGWLNQVEHLAEKEDFSCLVMDNRGYGNSDIPGGRYKTSEMAQDVLEVADHVGWTDVRALNVVGISMGGMIALEIAKRAPERVRSLTLISTTSGRGNGEKDFRVSLPPLTGVSTISRLIAGRTLGFDSDQYRVNRVTEMLFPTPFLERVNERDARKRTNRETFQEMFAFRYTFTRRQTLYGAMAQVRAVATHRVSPVQLQRINDAIPVITIITGDDDNLVNPGNSHHMKKHMPKAQLEILPGVGHVTVVQEPFKVNAILDRAFDEADKRLEQGKW